MAKEKVCRVPDITHIEWLQCRRTGIGGSDAATIADLNPHSSRFYLYFDKLGMIDAKPDNEAMRVGRDLEDYVARRWCEATGKRVRRNNFMWRSVEHPFMIADIDREVIGENACLECKTTSAYNHANLDAGEIPLNYYVQTLHYMSVMGYERAYLAVLVLGKGFYHFVIERDESEIAALVEQEREFWHLVEIRTPPEPDGSDATRSAIKARYCAATPGARVDLSEKAFSMLSVIDDLDAQIKELQAAKKEAQAAIECEMQDAEFGAVRDFLVTWKQQERTTIDSKRLKEELPDVWERYSKTTESRVFKYKKNKRMEVESCENF